MRRLHWAWHLRTWPWRIPTEVVEWLLPPCQVHISRAIRAHGERLAREFNP